MHIELPNSVKTVQFLQLCEKTFFQHLVIAGHYDKIRPDADDGCGRANCGRYDHTCDTNAHRDLNPAIRFKDKSEFSVLLLPCSHLWGVLLLARLWYHWSQWQLLRQCVLPCHRVNTNSCHLACTRVPHSHTVLLTFVSCSVSVEPTSTTLSTLHWRSIHILVKLF